MAQSVPGIDGDILVHKKVGTGPDMVAKDEAVCLIGCVN
jgi:hypothetical protein